MSSEEDTHLNVDSGGAPIEDSPGESNTGTQSGSTEHTEVPKLIQEDSNDVSEDNPILVPEIQVSPVVTPQDRNIKSRFVRRRGIKQSPTEGGLQGRSYRDECLQNEKSLKNLDSSTMKPQKNRFTLALQKKFNSLSFGRSQRNAGDVIRKDHVEFNKTASQKKTSSDVLVKSFQLGLAYAVGKITSKPERDVLLNDFTLTEEVYFPRNGSSITPSHKMNDFSMVDYSNVAFKYFRDIFEISPSDFMTSLGANPLVQISNPGASGSMFFLSEDDQFIVKSVDKRETVFLQQLLPGYYMNIHQNPLTYLPKFFGLYAFKTIGKTLRVVVMNNLLPSKLVFHEKYDLKGSTFKRRASSKERLKTLPTLKDLDFVLNHPMGLVLDSQVRKTLITVLERDVRVLQSFKIMDFSLLLSIHNVTQYEMALLGQERCKELGVESDKKPEIDRETYESYIAKGIPAKNRRGESLILFIGIIDILQNYRLAKKTEHRFKSLLHDGDTISVHNPNFYATRFIGFLKYVFQDASVEATPYPHLNAIHSFSGAVNNDYRASSLQIDKSVKKDNIHNEPRIIQTEPAEIRCEIPCENVELNQAAESEARSVEEDEI